MKRRLFQMLILSSATLSAHGFCGSVALRDSSFLPPNAENSADSAKSLVNAKVEYLPIASYDTDVGFGYGAKVFFLNQIGSDESFDIILFNSTKGERWYRLVFSVPDFELRQGTAFPLAVDVTIDYDKWINNNYFGIGNAARFEDREFYTKEPLEVNVTVSHAFSAQSVGQVGVKYRIVRNFRFEEGKSLGALPASLSPASASLASVFTVFRLDSRDSYINPSGGIVLQGEAEVSPKLGFSNDALSRFAVWMQYYERPLSSNSVVALRGGLQVLAGTDPPIQFLLPIGGNQTVRGSPQDRFLDKTSAVLNAELRFPLVWRFGGILGYDAGKVWSSVGKIDLPRWAVNPVVGLRLYMDTFVVRMDFGFGREATGFYLNFGHLF